MRFQALAVVAAVFAVTVASCSDNKDEPSRAGPSAAPSATVSTATSPDELARTIFADYEAMLREASILLASQPAAADLKPKVAELKERYIQRFVTYGRTRSRMDAAEQQKVDAAVSRLVTLKPAADLDVLNAAIARFQKTDAELAKQLTSLNILTQYAFFELLKKQEPAEAARLGID